MKKILLALAVAGLYHEGAIAQQRLSLYEECTGETCGPCAATNPDLWALISASGNANKVQLIKYMVPIPTAGSILYPQTATISGARRSYYSINSAPNGRLNGAPNSPTSSSPGHPGYLSQSEIDNSAAVASPFNITVSAAWNSTFDSVTATVNVTAVSAFAPAGANMKLRVALIQSLHYNTQPGTNGEKDFENVVRAMYPDAAGTSVANSWTSGTNQSYTIKGAVPYFVDKNASPYIVVWIQNDADKAVAQAAKSNILNSTMTNDLGVTGITRNLGCISGTSGNVAHTVTLRNSGSAAATSATIYYKLDNGAYVSQAWTGSLAAGATTNVTLNSLTASAGSHIVTDSVVMSNDVNGGNNVVFTAFVVKSTASNNLPLSTGFEMGSTGGFPAGWVPYDADGTGNTWVNGQGTNLAHNNSTYMPWYKTGTFAAGSYSLLMMPTPAISGAVALDFWEAYAQASPNSNDKLEVVYSTDCGATWTSIWSKTGIDHATTANPVAGTSWIPTANEWRLRSVDISNVPVNAILAFRATAGNGNRLFIDDVNIRSGAPTSVQQIIAANSVSIYPNPAREAARLEFALSQSSNVQVQVFDAVGRLVNTVADGNMTKGKHEVTIATANLAAGMYHVKIQTEEGSLTQRLSVVK